jgi:GNAT superfamily N-acetyltransferase
MLDQIHASYVLSADPARLDVRAIHEFLCGSYWASGIPRELVERAIVNSLCVGAYAADGRQVGFARFISDYATYCYVCDVYVLESDRGHGLASGMVAFAMKHPRLQGLRRWMLVTKGAQKVYAQAGFKPVAHPERHMEIVVPGIYRGQG